MTGTNTDENKLFGKKRTKYCSQCRISEADLFDVDDVASDSASAPSGDPLLEMNKMLRCSRCRVAHFCSQACQRKHFPVHKKLCKRLAQTLEQLESHLQHYSQQQQEPGRIEQVMLGSPYFIETRWQAFVEMEEVLRRYLPCQKALGDLTLTMAYSECDTAQRGGAVGLEVALAHYLQLIRIDPFASSERTEEIVALLLVACDYDEHAYTFIRFCTLAAPETRFATCFRFLQDCQHFQGPEDPWIYRKMELIQNELPENRDWIRMSLAFCTVMLLRVIKRLVRLRKDSVATTTIMNEASEDGPSSMIATTTITATEQEIREWVQDIDEKYPGFLFHLQNTIPLLPSDRFDVFHPSAPDACWHLLQDCFFLTPGVNSILGEFAGDEDD